ncbi:MAG: radical SAM protein, partial [Thermodesulfobacteriota bacterium]
MYLAAFVEERGHEVSLIDLEVEPMDFGELCEKIKEFKADIIGITTSTPTFYIVQAYAKNLKEALGLPIVVGGPHITALKDETFTEEFDFAVANEGEYTLVELLNEMEGEKNYAKINGLIYWKDGKIKLNPVRTFVSDLDSLPFPARTKIESDLYSFEVPGKGFIPVATIELTRGCPFQCVFCSEPINTGKLLRKRSAKNVVDEIFHVKKDFGIDHFFMLDSTLTVNRKLIEGFCNELIKREANISFEGQTRANLIDEELLLLLKKAGLNRLSFGLESSDEEVLALMKKKVPPESIREAFRLCKKHDISTLCGVMMGNPGDTRETILKTAHFVRSVPEIRYAPMAVAIPYPGTELLYMAAHNMHGLKLLESDWHRFSRYAGGVMEVDGMGPGELIKLQRRALFIMHLTPSKIMGLIQHFGFINLLGVGLKMLKNELILLLGGSEPMLTSIESENTTLKNMGLKPS